MPSASRRRRGELLSQAFRFPAGRPLGQEPASDLGLEAMFERTPEGTVLRVTSRRFAYGVRVAVAGWGASDDAFGVEPGHERRVALRPTVGAGEPPAGATLARHQPARIGPSQVARWRRGAGR